MTYLDFYGLSKPPFGGPRAENGFILFGSQKRSFELLVGHIVNGSGLVLLQAEEGVGKTEMLRAAGDVVTEAGGHAILVTRPPDGRASLAQLVVALGGPDASIETSAEDVVQRFLTSPRQALLVDDVDLMPEDCVQLLLTLLRTMPTDSAAPAVALSTSAELGSDPTRPDLAELVPFARNTIRLPRLAPAEVQQYIERSLWVAGGTVRRLMAPDALKMIVFRSGGVAASVDRLMEAAFNAGFARGEAMITGKTIVAMSGGAPRPPPRQRWIELELERVPERAIQFAAAMLLVTGASVFLYRAFNDAPPSPMPAVAPLATPPMPQVPPTPTPLTPPAKPAETMAPDLITALLKRGDQSIALGDTAAARLFFRHAADGGSAVAATALGRTYDPDYAALGDKPDRALAAEWYRKAVSLGDARAADLLKRLETR
jgi:type II secretory pathway predicted ATPase ExeA